MRKRKSRKRRKVYLVNHTGDDLFEVAGGDLSGYQEALLKGEKSWFSEPSIEVRWIQRLRGSHREVVLRTTLRRDLAVRLRESGYYLRGDRDGVVHVTKALVWYERLL